MRQQVHDDRQQLRFVSRWSWQQEKYHFKVPVSYQTNTYCALNQSSIQNVPQYDYYPTATQFNFENSVFLPGNRHPMMRQQTPDDQTGLIITFYRVKWKLLFGGQRVFADNIFAFAFEYSLDTQFQSFYFQTDLFQCCICSYTKV